MSAELYRFDKKLLLFQKYSAVFEIRKRAMIQNSNGVTEWSAIWKTKMIFKCGLFSLVHQYSKSLQKCLTVSVCTD